MSEDCLIIDSNQRVPNKVLRFTAEPAVCDFKMLLRVRRGKGHIPRMWCNPTRLSLSLGPVTLNRFLVSTGRFPLLKWERNKGLHDLCFVINLLIVLS